MSVLENTERGDTLELILLPGSSKVSFYSSN